MKFGSLFAGIGGMDLGLERAGMECAWQVEIDSFCTKVLTKHWPNIPKFGDIRNVGKEELETVDLIIGGAPCQPFSGAGKQKGTADDRHLWPEMLRIISELKPTWIIFENVTGIINIFLDQAIFEMEAEGYTCETLVLPACAFNAPHRRDRVFVVAYSVRIGRGGRNNENAQRQIGPLQTEGPCTRNQSRILANTNSERGRSRNAERENAEDVRKSPRCERFRDWDVEPGVGRVVNGVPDRVDRLKGLGNAVVPQVAEHIGRMIMEVVENEYKSSQKITASNTA